MVAAWLLGGTALVAAISCGGAAEDPKKEGVGMPIEITEEHPVSSPGVAEEPRPSPP